MSISNKALIVLCAVIMACDSGRAPLEPGEEAAVPDLQPGVAAAAANSWTFKQETPLPARINMAAATVNGVIYVVGGNPDAAPFPGGTTAIVDGYNLGTNTWSRRQRMPGQRDNVNGVSLYAGKLYVTGGRKPTCTGSCTTFLTKTLFIYDPATDSWSQGPDMPVEGSAGVQGVHNGRIYVYQGASSAGGAGAFLRYIPSVNSWVTLSPPPSKHQNGVGGMIGGKFYLAGGTGGHDDFPQATLHVYDPATHTWATKAPMSVAREHAAGGVINGKLYVAGGQTLEGSKLRSVEVYDPVTDTWTTKAEMLSPQAFAAGAVTGGGKLFVIGGIGPSGPTRTVQMYTP
jgi:N-acetylneuraminic acid mutarotase